MIFIAMFFVVVGLIGLIDAIIQTNRYKNKYDRDNDTEPMG
jgi:Tfp pilus assembly protein PilV